MKWGIKGDLLFNSLQFAIFLPIVFIIYWIIPIKIRWLILLVASYYFYMSWNAKYIFILVLTTIISFFSALLLEKADTEKKRKIILASSLICCLAFLFIFKYIGFAFESICKIAQVFSIHLNPLTLNLLLPVGISFYTFQTISYVVDVYRRDVKAEHNLGIYATFISFFPQLVAGPIERTSNLLPQIKGKCQFEANRAIEGAKLMLFGFLRSL